MQKDYHILADYIVDNYIRSISGMDVESNGVLVGEEPFGKVMVGMLAEDRIEDSLGGAYRENTATKFESVPSISLNFLVSGKSKGSLVVIPDASLYYSVKPSYEETVNYILKKYSRRDKKEYKTIQELEKHLKSVSGDSGKPPSTETIKLPKFYKKIEFKDYIGDGIRIDIEEFQKRELHFEEALVFRFQKAADLISEEIYLLQDSVVSIDALLSKQDFDRAVIRKKDRIQPRWRMDVVFRCIKEVEYWNCSLQIVNKTPVGSMARQGYIPKLFNASLKVRGDCGIQFEVIEPDYFKRTYKKKKPLYATAENASAKYIKEENAIATENIPVYYQHRTRTKDQLTQLISFDRLIKDPVSNLNKIYEKMAADVEKLEQEYYINSKGMGEAARDQYKRAVEDYKNEVGRFKLGIEQIEYKDYVRRAFILMNQTFGCRLEGDQRQISGWRLFQIVFIVSMIGNVIRSEYKEDEGLRETDIEIADLLYFPTGGGKTEAFLGITVFAMFFDRLRGKNEGVTAWIKYPLRLLAVQQLERVLTITMKAERIRQTELSGAAHPFSVGFYVGKNNTPNKIGPFEKLSDRGRGGNYGTIFESDQDTLNEYYRFIDTCPCCGKRTVNVRFDKERWVLAHYCDNKECPAVVLPLYIVDNEIYRFLPSVIVSTIDKMAILGTSQEFKMLLGQVKFKCPKHGYTYNAYCICGDRDCQCSLEETDLLKDPVPSLFIQDEMHLVRESLGTFDSHYETFADYYAKALMPETQRKNICFIGATATIASYRRHIQNVYHKQGRRFPCEYPSMETGEDFYSYTDRKDITRIILGYAPYGRSLTDGVWESVYRMRLVVYELFEQMDKHYIILREKGFKGSESEYQDMLYDYWMELVYNNRKQDAMELENSFQNQGNNRLEELYIPRFEIKQMTSDTDFQTVRKTLFDVKMNRKNRNSTNLLLATSTISHGVDEDSFNIMYFFGMPNNNAEYIQAYSRTGRKYTGIVIDIIRLMRLRDRSYLKNFMMFHENRDDLVESVPVNRWAKNAVYSTLPGLLAGLLMQYYAPKLNASSFYSAVQVQKALRKKDIVAEEAAEHLIKAYGCNGQEKMSLGYENIIRKEVAAILDGIETGSFDNKISLSEAIGRYSKGGKRPMTSLRDTEEQVEIQI